MDWLEEAIRDRFYSKSTIITGFLKGGEDKWVITKKEFNLYAKELASAIREEIGKRRPKSKRMKNYEFVYDVDEKWSYNSALADYDKALEIKED